MTADHATPAAHRSHPIQSVLRDGEMFRELARKIEYGEISWPQSYIMGDPIIINSNHQNQGTQNGITSDTDAAGNHR